MTVQIPALSTPPSRQDPTNFRAAADTFLGELPAFGLTANLQNVENNTINTNVNSKTLIAEAASAAAVVSAASAAATSTAPNWVSGTTYAVGNVRRSLIDGLPYQRITTGDGTTDPRNDTANWVLDYFQRDTGLPNIKPTLLLDPVNSGVVDSRIVTTRASTATYIDAFGNIQSAPANTLRIDHDPVTGERLGYLLEPGSTNLLTNSQDMSGTGWSGCTKTLAAEVFRGLAPFYEAAKNTTGDSLVSNASTIAAGGTVTITVALLAGTETTALVGLFGATNEGASTFWGAPVDCSKAILEGPGTFELFSASFGALWRVVGLSASVPTVLRITRKFNAEQSSSLRLYPGSNTASPVGASVKVARAQFELATGSTSYIPTSGAAVTRAADVGIISGTNFSDFYNPTEGTLVVSARWLGAPTGAAYPALLTNTGYTNSLGVSQFSATAVKDSAAQTSGLGYPAVPFGTVAKVAFAFKKDYFAVSANGGAPMVDSSGDMPTPDRLNMFVSNTGSAGVIIESATYYPRAVQSSELQAMSRQ